MSLDAQVALLVAIYFVGTAAIWSAFTFLTGDTMIWCVLAISSFLVASLCVLVSCRPRRRIVPISERRGSEDMLAIVNTQCPPEQLADDRCDGAHCVVCLLPMGAGELCRTMHCRHTFHSECIQEWWFHQMRKMPGQLPCPICRQAQPPKAESSIAWAPRP